MTIDFDNDNWKISKSPQVAVIASNFELAEMIQNYKSEDIGECPIILLQFISHKLFWHTLRIVDRFLREISKSSDLMEIFIVSWPCC
jgi:hypothetical protein